MPRPATDERVSIAIAAFELHASADRTRRRVQTGELAGGVEGGKWYVLRSALDAAKGAAGAECPTFVAA